MSSITTITENGRVSGESSMARPTSISVERALRGNDPIGISDGRKSLQIE